MAMLIQDHLDSKKPNLAEFLKTNGLDNVIEKRFNKLEDKDSIEEFVSKEISEDHQATILKVLKLSESE